MQCASYDPLGECVRASDSVRMANPRGFFRNTTNQDDDTMTVRRHKTATMPPLLFGSVFRRFGYYGKNNLMCSDATTSGSTFFSNVCASSGLLIQALNLLICTAILSYHRALLHIRFLWCRLSAACSHTPFARLTLTLSLPFAPVTFSLLRILLSQQGGEGGGRKKAHLSLICVVPGSIPRCLAETP